ncbi:MAG: tetratricopeptide repeat protein [Ginsengibacter sp.]
MRKFISSMLCMVFLLITLQGNSQKMEWTTTSEVASTLGHEGSVHMMNAEFEQAYQNFSEAVKLDPDFTVALVFMTNLTYGNVRKDYAQKALKSATNKTEGEKLFASLVDSAGTQQSRSDTWAKLHAMFPDGAVLAHFYVITRATPGESFNAAEDYVKKFPDQPGMYNNLAYFYLQNKKDTAMAKQYFEKYITMYPEGANPYDSMGEFCLDTGDADNAEKYYRMALEKYPFLNSSVNALQKINAGKKK